MVNADFWGEPQRGGFWGDEPEPPRLRSPRTTAVDLPVQRPPRRQPSRRPQREEPPRRPPRPDADARRPSGNTRSQKNQKKKRKRSGLVTALALVILFASLGGGASISLALGQGARWIVFWPVSSANTQDQISSVM